MTLWGDGFTKAGEEYVVLGGEVSKKSPRRDVRRLGDVVDGGLVVAPLAKELPRLGHQRVPGPGLLSRS